MPNPFPGMNPYLENPLLWPDIHLSLICCMRAEMTKELPEGYSARIGERVYHDDSSDLDDVRERFITIRSARDDREVVAVIEVLSPANKQDGRGREAYLRKQRDLLDSNAHFLEIDLLRAGQYTLAPPEAGARYELGYWDYLISLHRADGGMNFETWPIYLQNRLPKLTIPLVRENETISINLQAALNRAYEEGDQGAEIDYTKDAVPPLAGTDAEWADALLKNAGLRP